MPASARVVAPPRAPGPSAKGRRQGPSGRGATSLSRDPGRWISQGRGHTVTFSVPLLHPLSLGFSRGDVRERNNRGREGSLSSEPLDAWPKSSIQGSRLRGRAPSYAGPPCPCRRHCRPRPGPEPKRGGRPPLQAGTCSRRASGGGRSSVGPELEGRRRDGGN